MCYHKVEEDFEGRRLEDVVVNKDGYKPIARKGSSLRIACSRKMLKHPLAVIKVRPDAFPEP